MRRRGFEFFMAVASRVDAAREAGASPSAADRCLHALGERVWHRPLRSALGMARLRRACSADGPIAPELLAFYRTIGVPLRRLPTRWGTAERAA
jgi:long-chain acyl-CoA synthetase